jgi:hypothetical protein
MNSLPSTPASLAWEVFGPEPRLALEPEPRPAIGCAGPALLTDDEVEAVGGGLIPLTLLVIGIGAALLMAHD